MYVCMYVCMYVYKHFHNTSVYNYLITHTELKLNY